VKKEEDPFLIMANDLGLEYFYERRELPLWLFEFIERLINSGWKK